MKILSLTSCDNRNSNSIAIGIFDGLHRGHIKILNQLKEAGPCTSVLSFYPHPRRKTKLIQRLKERLALFRSIGINNAIVIEPTDEIMSMTAMQFLQTVLIPMNVKNIYIGSDFKLGHNRKTDAEAFKLMCHQKGVLVNIVLPELEGGAKISSSDIRKRIEEGDIENTEKLLGRPYSITGSVVHGRCMAKNLGFKTANIRPHKALVIPKNGVYSTRTYIDGKGYDSSTYVGTSPTLTRSQEVIVETHIPDFDRNLYGHKITVIFKKRIRNELKYKSIEDLKSAISHDVATSS